MTNAAKILTILSLIVGSIAYADWKSDYKLAPGFSLSIDTEGFQLPVAIAFVPEPGPKPEDPLYFITELRGKIKVVTNDRTVHVFAEEFYPAEVEAELPDIRGEVGLAGIALDSKNGYVFVSYCFIDGAGLYRNAISRFETTPGIFSIKPESHRTIAPVFNHHLSQVSHQIGPMLVVEDKLFVCVGDAEVASNSRDLDSPMGKILRFNLDGSVPDGNPHALDDDPIKARNLIWASGLRNPFSITLAGERIYVCDNGPSTDRMVEIIRGTDYLYDGTNDSSSSNARYVWNNAVSPVQMDFDPSLAEKAGFPKQLHNSAYITLSGAPNSPSGAGKWGQKSIVAIGIDSDSGMITHTPQQIYAYDGTGSQLPVGLGWGPDGLYVVNLLPDSEGESRILKLSYENGDEHPKIIAPDPWTLVRQYACVSCHQIDNIGNGHVAPQILRAGITERLLEKLSSPAYLEQVDEIDKLNASPFNEYRNIRKQILESEGREKVLEWVTYRIMEPRFDQKTIAMPNQGIKYREARQMAEWLLAVDEYSENSATEQIKALLPSPSHKSMLAFFAIGKIAGIVLAFVGVYFLIRKRRGK
ncbi:PQQ-dependent sugar dehydrogenase [Pelagicoccus sp. SDUM812002]|uniref:PQQ-dependent sugar dehydrogenase n=1 Tax=Pelagicoccus sp. SDUM812002 TaxID=3041266 RepID=UPI00280DA4F7|nr:PQQ-dependent sugar dehydrogenase [Pelagicoccus sp. SDUM812002]MDQ8187864.1 PQQ-dependent sugar dehydrogenase [Pelagicoccus sp. SDUM812002]